MKEIIINCNRPKETVKIPQQLTETRKYCDKDKEAVATQQVKTNNTDKKDSV